MSVGPRQRKPISQARYNDCRMPSHHPRQQHEQRKARPARQRRALNHPPLASLNVSPFVSGAQAMDTTIPTKSTPANASIVT